MTMKTKEGVCRVFAGDFLVEQDREPAWMKIGEFGEVKHFAVNDNPEVSSFVVLAERREPSAYVSCPSLRTLRYYD